MGLTFKQRAADSVETPPAGTLRPFADEAGNLCLMDADRNVVALAKVVDVDLADDSPQLVRPVIKGGFMEGTLIGPNCQFLDGLATIRSLGALPKTGDGGLGGFTSSLWHFGNSSGQTITPEPWGSNFFYIDNNGAFTLSAPTDGNSFTMIIRVYNQAGSGAMTATGFTQVTGTFDGTTGKNQLLYVTKVNGDCFLDIRVMN